MEEDALSLLPPFSFDDLQSGSHIFFFFSPPSSSSSSSSKEVQFHKSEEKEGFEMCFRPLALTKIKSQAVLAMAHAPQAIINLFLSLPLFSRPSSLPLNDHIKDCFHFTSGQKQQQQQLRLSKAPFPRPRAPQVATIAK